MGRNSSFKPLDKSKGKKFRSENRRKRNKIPLEVKKKQAQQ